MQVIITALSFDPPFLSTDYVPFLDVRRQIWCRTANALGSGEHRY
jgi:hypothetical protein